MARRPRYFVKGQPQHKESQVLHCATKTQGLTRMALT
jgi:hypothetical protein